MNQAKEILDKWLLDRGFKTYKELATFLNVSQNTLDVWKQRGKIPEKNLLKYAQLCEKFHRTLTIPNQINFHISDKEIEILNAYRELTEEDQEIFYHELKAAAAKARKRAKENENIIHEDVKSVV